MTEPNYVQQVTSLLAQHLPGCDPELLALYTLLALSRGTRTSLKDVHDAWAVWRNATNPAHRSLLTFNDLAAEVQELDCKYMEAIHEATQAVSG
jgi:hypothetical protein